MAIDLDPTDVVTLPATASVTLDKLWIRQIIIQTPSPLAEGSVRVEYGPWSGDMTKDPIWRNSAGEDIVKVISLSDMYATLALVPELNTAFNAILDAVKPVEKYIADKAAADAAAAEAQNTP